MKSCLLHIRWYNHRDLDWHRDVTSLNPSYHID